MSECILLLYNKYLRYIFMIHSFYTFFLIQVGKIENKWWFDIWCWLQLSKMSASNLCRGILVRSGRLGTCSVAVRGLSSKPSDIETHTGQVL